MASKFRAQLDARRSELIGQLVENELQGTGVQVRQAWLTSQQHVAECDGKLLPSRPGR